MYRNIIPVLFLFSVVAFDSFAHEVDTWVDQNDLIIEVRGTVQHRDGKPVPDANVRFVDPRRILEDDYKSVATVTNQEGGFSLKYNVVDAFRHLLIAETNDREWIGCYCFHFELSESSQSSGAWPRRKPDIDAKGKVREVPLPDIEKLRNISITLLKMSMIRGKVVDDSDKPVHNAWIGSRYLYAHKYFTHVDLTQCRSNENGEFELAVLKNRPLDERFVFHREQGAFFTHSRHKMVEQPPTSDNAWNVRIKRYPTRVRLVDQATSSPRTDFWVRTREVNHQLEANSSPFYAVPDENGVAHLPWIPPAEQLVTFYPEDFRVRAWHYAEEPKEETTITLKNRPVKIYGRMTFPEGKPASKIRLVYHTSLYQTEEPNTEAFNQTWTDSDGRYMVEVFSSVFSGSPVDTFELYLFPDVDGWVPERLPTIRFPADGTPIRFDLGLRKPTVIRGTVTRNHAQQGKTPEKDIELQLTGSLYQHWFMSGSAVKMETWIQKTDENGNFRFEVGPGFYSLRGAGVLESNIAVESQEEIVIGSETAYRNMTGTVVDVSRNEQPVVGAKVGYPVFANTFSFNTETGKREVPFFHELREAFELLRYRKRDDGFVFSQRVTTPSNMGLYFRRKIHESGFDVCGLGVGVPWPKLFVNLRSSCITDYSRLGYSEKLLNAIFGNSEQVRKKHYIQLRNRNEYRKILDDNAAIIDLLKRHGGSFENDADFEFCIHELFFRKTLVELAAPRPEPGIHGIFPN